jgi:hypothetical protein
VSTTTTTTYEHTVTCDICGGQDTTTTEEHRRPSLPQGWQRLGITGSGTPARTGVAATPDIAVDVCGECIAARSLADLDRALRDSKATSA